MAGRIKGITIEINGDTKNLNTALKDVDKTAAKTTTELNAINRGLKFDADSPVLLKQKFEVLQDAIKTTSTRLDALKQAQEEVNRQFASGEIDAATYRKFQREIEQTEGKLRAFKSQADSVKSKVDVQADTSALDKVKTAIRELPDEAKQAGKEIGRALSTGAAGVTAAGTMVDSPVKLKMLNEALAIIENRLNAMAELGIKVD